MVGEPREFGPYRLVRRLGVGGMAETFEAARVGASGFEQRVCLKRVLPAFGQDDDFVSRFRREARLAAQLRHTNIVGVIGFGEIDGLQYIALELVDGVDLRSLLRSAPGERLPPETVALIGFDLARALEHAHGTLVHRDISPSNILLSRTGEAKLADFGLAKAIDNTTAAASRSARGKIPYMAPEHMRGEPVDGRADLFSLGVVMFEAVAGVRPFDGAHDVETMQRILQGHARSLEQLAPQAPRPLRKAIERLIEVKPEARVPSASHLLEELAQIAPTPAVRRSLADTVESYRGGPSARLHVRARDAEPDTELTRPPTIASSLPEANPSPTSRSPRKGRHVLTWSGLVAAGLIAVAAGWWLEPRSAGTETATATETAAAPATETKTAAATETASGAATPTKTPRRAAPAAETATSTASEKATVTPAVRTPAAKGRLVVIVQPWGNVWIDGVWMGRAPVEARLPKGRHVIEAGRELPAETRIVRLGAGVRKEVEIQLSE
jgi:serine/threonine protein kinase